METTIPFSGFYESVHSDRLDRWLGVSDNDFYEAESEDNAGTPQDEREYPTTKELEKRLDEIDWKKERSEYAAQYADKFSGFIGVPLKVIELSSPREYNFTTDRIFCDIEEKDFIHIFGLVAQPLLAQKIKEQYTSRDGFSSFYSGDINDWPNDITEWDHNQVGTVLETYAEQILIGNADEGNPKHDGREKFYEWEAYTSFDITC